MKGCRFKPQAIEAIFQLRLEKKNQQAPLTRPMTLIKLITLNKSSPEPILHKKNIPRQGQKKEGDLCS